MSKAWIFQFVLKIMLAKGNSVSARREQKISRTGTAQVQHRVDVFRGLQCQPDDIKRTENANKARAREDLTTDFSRGGCKCRVSTDA